MSQTCKKCRRVQRFEFNIRDDIWNQIDPLYRESALCIECFLEELRFANPDQTITSEDFGFIGILDPEMDDKTGKDIYPNFGGTLIDRIE
jgi:hypothetical protein